MEASDILIIVGSIIRPKRMEAVSTLMPLPPKVSRTKGTNITSPKNPYTTEGIPAMRLVAGFIILYSHGGQNLAMNTAVSMPMGTPMTRAPAVT